MSAQEKARQNITEQKHQQRHRQQSMLGRSEAEIADINDAEIQEKARELLAKQRQQLEHRTLSMKYRSEEEIEISDQANYSVE